MKNLKKKNHPFFCLKLLFLKKTKMKYNQSEKSFKEKMK